MKLVGIPVLVLLTFSLFATLVLNISSPLLLYSLFNAIVLAILVGSLTPSGHEAEGVWPPFHPSCEGGVNLNRKIEEEDDYDGSSNDYEYDSSSHDEDGDDDYEYGSDGYDEDDDENGSDGEIGWEDDEESDGGLDGRIEEFISKVYRGWREEWLKDHVQYPTWFG